VECVISTKNPEAKTDSQSTQNHRLPRRLATSLPFIAASPLSDDRTIKPNELRTVFWILRCSRIRRWRRRQHIVRFVDRLVELSHNNGSLAFIYPTKTGAKTFTNQSFGPIRM
jgi:hypothetical protein